MSADSRRRDRRDDTLLEQSRQLRTALNSTLHELEQFVQALDYRAESLHDPEGDSSDEQS